MQGRAAALYEIEQILTAHTPETIAHEFIKATKELNEQHRRT
jgi:hypothetical protein